MKKYVLDIRLQPLDAWIEANTWTIRDIICEETDRTGSTPQDTQVAENTGSFKVTATIRRMAAAFFSSIA